MQYRRILVLGCPGSGKTTFALRLSKLTGLPNVHLDKLFWKPGWTASTREAFYPLLEKALSADEWIMDGNYGNSLPLRLQYCDQIIYFDLPRLICLWGIISRYLKNRGLSRPDMGDGCPEKIDGAFIRYTWAFRRSKRDNILAKCHASEKPVIIFRSRQEARSFIKDIKNDNAANRENNAPTID